MNDPHLYIFHCRDSNNCAFSVQVISTSEHEAYEQLWTSYWRNIVVDWVDYYE